MDFFKKYQHVERYGNEEVDGINIGECYVFPKLDGTNASVWLGDDNEIHAGSRNRELSLDKDNAGFLEWAMRQDHLIEFFAEYPYLRLFGEWLVPHSLKTYRDDAWNKFYVFDVMDHDAEWPVRGLKEQGRYMPYLEYKPLLEDFGIEYIPPIKIIHNGEYEDFVFQQKQNNDYLIKPDSGMGEGVVIKNYDFVNKYGRTTWAKIVTSEFKEVFHKTMGPSTKTNKMVEEEIVEKYVTKTLCEKIFNKIKTEKDGWRSQYIPELLGRVFYDLITEETWNFVKEHKKPKIDFKTLNHFTIGRIKEHLPQLF